MANTTATNQHTQNQPSHESSVKGGQNSQMGKQTNMENGGSGKAGSYNQPSHEAQVKGGEHSHSGGRS